MPEYETEMIKLMKQIAEDIRWLRRVPRSAIGLNSKTMKSF
jgi:hypothetical protein